MQKKSSLLVGWFIILSLQSSTTTDLTLVWRLLLARPFRVREVILIRGIHGWRTISIWKKRFPNLSKFQPCLHCWPNIPKSVFSSSSRTNVTFANPTLNPNPSMDPYPNITNHTIVITDQCYISEFPWPNHFSTPTLGSNPSYSLSHHPENNLGLKHITQS